jgi:hypothetical protein
MLQGSKLLSTRGECAIPRTGGVQDIESSIPLLARAVMFRVLNNKCDISQEFPDPL